MPLFMFQCHDSRITVQNMTLSTYITQQHIMLNAAHVRFYKDITTKDQNGAIIANDSYTRVPADIPEFLKVLYVDVDWLNNNDVHSTSLSPNIPIPVVWGGTRLNNATDEVREVYVNNLNYEFNLAQPIKQHFGVKVHKEPYNKDIGMVERAEKAVWDTTTTLLNNNTERVEVYCSIDLYFTFRRNA